MSNPVQETPPPFDPNAAHQQKPQLRAVRGFPVQAGDKTLLGLSDARQISDRAVFVVPAVQMILPLMDGTRNLDEITAAVGKGLTRDILEGLVAQLDHAGLLVGPAFEALKAKMRAEFDSTAILPPASTANIADSMAQQLLPAGVTEEQKAEIGVNRFRETLDQWMAEALKDAPNPTFDVLPKAVVVPHVDYPRGWINYAQVWGRTRVADRPARVVILGTNHFGEATGVCGCNKGYESPFGVCELDSQLVDALKMNLGPDESEKLFAHRYDHEREHSIELQIPWIQHCLGKDESGNYPKVFAALVHDPAVNNGESYDGNGVSFDTFVQAMQKTLPLLPGRTLVVSSADLSHVGPSFGDQQPLAGESEEANEFRNKIFQHDREMLQMFAEQKFDEMMTSFAWQQNPTRWCSLGNMLAAAKIVEPERIEIFNYMAAMDQQGQGMVSSAALAMH